MYEYNTVVDIVAEKIRYCHHTNENISQKFNALNIDGTI